MNTFIGMNTGEKGEQCYFVCDNFNNRLSTAHSEKKWQKCKPPGLAGCLCCRALDPGTSWAPCYTGSPATAWMSNDQTALTCGSGVTNNFLHRDISCCNYDRGKQHRQGEPARTAGQGTPALCSAPATLCASTSYTRSIPLLYLSPQGTQKVSLAQGRAKEKNLLGSGAKQTHLFEASGLLAGFLLILQNRN